jgi:hypothetical protein
MIAEITINEHIMYSSVGEFVIVMRNPGNPGSAAVDAPGIS